MVRVMKQTSEQAELLIEAAKLLYGERWSGALSQAIGVHQRTLQSIAEGRYDLKKDHPMIGETLDLLRERQRDINKFMNNMVSAARAEKASPARRVTPVAGSRSTSKSASTHSRS